MILIGIAGCGVVYVNFTIDNLKIENIDKISVIYSSDEFLETRYSSNTKEKAQHLIEITNGSWKQECEKNDECFIPYMKTIGANEAILFVNQDEYEHNIRVKGDPSYLHHPTDVIRQNEYFVYKFNESGEYDYYCTLHPWMEGMITVNE